MSDIGEAFERLGAASRRVVLCDFDGTLAPIVPRPEDATILPEARRALQRLAAAPASDVGLISGRGLADLMERVTLPGIGYAGCGGLEIQLPDGTRLEPPEAELIRAAIAALADRVESALEKTGCQVERKGLSVAVHWRQAGAQLEPRVREVVEDSVASADVPLRITPGKMVFEVRPAGQGGKGYAVERLLEALPGTDGRVCAFLGDDVVDEEAFEVVRAAGGVTVYVGEPDGPTAAEYRLGDPQAVAEFLTAVSNASSP